MKLHRHVLSIILIGIVIFVISIIHQSLAMNRDYSLPNDDFSPSTIDEIHKDLAQYNVVETPRNYEVYMVTGGIGVANPRIMEWDSMGNMTFGYNGSPGYLFQIHESKQNPMIWKQQIVHGKLEPKTKQGLTFTYKPIHWIKHTTGIGQIYYQMDDHKQPTLYFFKKGHTYIVVQSFPSDIFPVSLMNHLKPIGNLVTQ